MPPVYKFISKYEIRTDISPQSQLNTRETFTDSQHSSNNGESDSHSHNLVDLSADNEGQDGDDDDDDDEYNNDTIHGTILSTRYTSS